MQMCVPDHLPAPMMPEPRMGVHAITLVPNGPGGTHNTLRLHIRQLADDDDDEDAEEGHAVRMHASLVHATAASLVHAAPICCGISQRSPL